MLAVLVRPPGVSRARRALSLAATIAAPVGDAAATVPTGAPPREGRPVAPRVSLETGVPRVEEA